MNCKRKDLTLKEKVSVLEYANANKCTQLELAKMFQISQAQVSKLLKNKEKILNAIRSNANLNLRRQRSGKESAIEDALLRWCFEAQALNIPINGLMLSQKAEDIARELNIENFKPTNGWLCRWKKRNQISFKKNPVEIYDAAVEMMNRPWNSASPYSPFIIKNYFVKCKFSNDALKDEEAVNNDKNESLPENKSLKLTNFENDSQKSAKVNNDNEPLPKNKSSKLTNFENESQKSAEVNNDDESLPKNKSSKLTNFENDSQKSVEMTDYDFSEKEIEHGDEDAAGEKCCRETNISSAEVTNACNIMRCFLESKANVNLDLFNALENQITDLLQTEKKTDLLDKKCLALSTQTKHFKYPYSVPARVQREELQVVAEALGSLRRCFPANDPRQHTLDTVEQSLAALLERINALEMVPSVLMSSPSVRRSNGDKEAPHSLPTLHHGETADNFQEDFGGTKVVYYMDKSLTPFRCILHKRIGEATLRDFKLLFDRPGQFRYHFKTLDPEFGMVKEEVLNDDDILPGWDSKIVAWIEEECS